MAVILDTNSLSAFLKNEPGGSARRATLTAKLEAFLADVRILAIDEAASCVYAVVRDELQAAGTPIPENDVWIASLVRQNGLPLGERRCALRSRCRLRSPLLEADHLIVPGQVVRDRPMPRSGASDSGIRPASAGPRGSRS